MPIIRRSNEEFKESNTALKKIFEFKDDTRGEFKTNYYGPYLVTEVLSRGALILSAMDGDVLL